MASKTLFKSKGSSKSVPVADTVNNAGGKAYSHSKKHALAQIACTNTFGGTYYVSADTTLQLAKEAALHLVDDPEFIAKTAVYSRDRAYMKDMPAFLMCVLADVDTDLFRRVFPQVIDNTKMLRNFCQIARSGAATGRIFNLSSGVVRKTIQQWFTNHKPEYLFRSAIGNNPTVADVLRMTRPRPCCEKRAALYAYLLGAERDGDVIVSNGPNKSRRIHKFEDLPKLVKDFERYKETKEGEVPDLDFRMLDSLGLGTKEWTEVARNARWTMLRMNLNTFARHGVFGQKGMSKLLADRLRDPEEIQKARAFPYQLLMAWKAISHNHEVPHEIGEALQDAMEVAVSNVPSVEGQVYVCVDSSGSMECSLTGSWNTKPSEARCIDVAALIASAVLRQNPRAQIWTFSSDAVRVSLNSRDSVMTNARILGSAGGGTNCSAPLRKFNESDAKGDTVIYVSDCESWLDNRSYYSGGTGMQTEWNRFKKRNPNAKLVCIDLVPRSDSQVKQHTDVLQVGGWSDAAFDVVSNFIKHGDEADFWVSEIEKVSLA